MLGTAFSMYECGATRFCERELGATTPGDSA